VPADFVLKTQHRVGALIRARAAGLPGLALGVVLMPSAGVLGLATGVLAATALTGVALWIAVARSLRGEPQPPPPVR